MQHEEPPALVAARGELAHAESKIVLAQAILDQAPAVRDLAYRMALAERSYYRQQADRWRTAVALLLREQGGPRD